MSGLDAGRITYSYQNAEQDNRVFDEKEYKGSQQVENFKWFLKTYEQKFAVDGTQRGSLYMDELSDRQSCLYVDLEHIRCWQSSLGKDLANDLEESPVETLPRFEEAATLVLQEVQHKDAEGREPQVAPVQIMLFSSKPLHSDTHKRASVRDIDAIRVTKLVQVTGIITSSSKAKHKATHLTLQCRTCRGTKVVPCKPGMGGAFLPTMCDMGKAVPNSEGCGMNSFSIVPDQSKFVDQQNLKLQEKPEDVPTGELPRTVQLVADRQCCNAVTPGTRVTVLGIYATYRGKAMDKGVVSLQQPYIRVVSVVQDAGDAHSRFKFSVEEIQQFEQFAKQDKVHDELFGRIAPNIYGSDDIKRALACLLFGGARKTLPDGTNRRGDINVLLLGDPSTAKSQFLKYVSKVAPISVYTSGKGSSAAGLTAAVVQDPNTREFYLEGGAMVLADNGVVCIDEFDKMRPEDRVAIHEAMEQQTISIAKAGITTMLKSRTSVLAAANPPSGRYDDMKTAQENIDLQSTILSRFDLIFIVKDKREHDMAIARHVLDNHRLGGTRNEQGDENAQEVEFLKRYIHFCRSQCSPRLTEEAARKLASYYVDIRNEARSTAEQNDSDSPPVPITVRQLEALIRLSESLARMALQTTATLDHVAMAVDLFKKSTMDAVKSGMTQGEIGNEQQQGHARRLEERIRRRLHIGAYMQLRRLLDEMAALGEPENMVMRVLLAMTARQEMELSRERTMVHRVR